MRATYPREDGKRSREGVITNPLTRGPMTTDVQIAGLIRRGSRGSKLSFEIKW
jgi:hypothetical protein